MGVCNRQPLAKSKGVHCEVESEGSWRQMRNEELSKIISHALRHKPEDYNLKLSKDGWVSLDELVSNIKNKVVEYSNLKSDDIIKLISEATKRRHEIKEGQIRALHGHSIEIKTTNRPLMPPAKLFHATMQLL